MTQFEKACIAACNAFLAEYVFDGGGNMGATENKQESSVTRDSNGVPSCHGKKMGVSKYCKDESRDYYYCVHKFEDGKYCKNKAGR